MTPLSLSVVLLYNAPSLPADHPDAASEAGVLEAVEATQRALRHGGHRVQLHGVGSSPAKLVEDLTAAAPQVVFNLCEGLQGVGAGESQVAGIVELLGIPLTGSASTALGLVRDKARTKWLLSGAGLPTADFCLATAGQPLDREACQRLLAQGPVIAKPAHEDASLGIGKDSVAGDLTELEAAVARVAKRYGAVLIERFIAGREFNAAVVGWPEARLLPLAEIEFDRRLMPARAWLRMTPSGRPTARLIGLRRRAVRRSSRRSWPSESAPPRWAPCVPRAAAITRASICA